MKEYYKLYRITHKERKHPTVYEISNYGNVKVNGKIYEPNKNTVSAYYTAGCFYIHRMVAEIFINNPYNYPEVDHIDGDTHNNRVDNLRWCTHKQNLNNNITIKRISLSQIGNNYALGSVRTIEYKEKQSLIHKGFKHSEETKKLISERNKGENNPMYGKKLKDFMTEEAYEKWLNNLKGHKAWNKGKDCSMYKHDNTKGKIWIHNNIENKMINPKELQIYISNGYTLGRKKKL